MYHPVLRVRISDFSFILAAAAVLGCVKVPTVKVSAVRTKGGHQAIVLRDLASGACLDVRLPCVFCGLFSFIEFILFDGSVSKTAGELQRSARL